MMILSYLAFCGLVFSVIDSQSDQAEQSISTFLLNTALPGYDGAMI